MTREEWITRYKAQLLFYCPHLGDNNAQDLAESSYADNLDSYPNDPEDAADDEMSYWK